MAALPPLKARSARLASLSPAQRQWRGLAALAAPLSLVAAPVVLRLDVPLCLFRAATSLPCPLCGGIHAGAALTQGEWLVAWQANPGVTLGLSLAAIHGSVLLIEAATGKRRWGASGLWRQAWLGVALVLLFDWSLRLLSRL
ncbi:MAG: DUF2752 domain-containing protein [Rhodocyclaceae bacterium]|jgi:hypothetical protein|nr:DUF2752 domain-containing protein [Rhodocyclaceae bacterium]